MSSNGNKITPGPKKSPPSDSTRGQKEARALAERIIDDPDYRNNLRRRAVAGILPPAVEIALWHYCFGKPIDRIERKDVQDFSNLSDAELAEKAKDLAQTALLMSKEVKPGISN